MTDRDKFNITEEEEADDDNEPTILDKQIAELGPCAPAYWEMDKCLDETGKDWLKCQDKVLALKNCWNKLEVMGQRSVKREREMILKLEQLKAMHKEGKL